MRGIAVIWLNILGGIFIVALVYIIFSNVIFGSITPQFFPQLQAIDPTTSGVNTTALFQTWNLVAMVWYLWPLIFVFSLIFYGIVRSQKREYELGIQ